MGAHLDSWDLSPGASDDAAGVAAVLAAARAITSAEIRPDRTVRFVLLTGEEQGLLGSRAYVEQHRAELPNILCALVVDWGAGPITRFPLAGHPELEKSLRNLLETEASLQSLRTSSGFLTFTDGFASPWRLLQDSPRYDRDAHSPRTNARSARCARSFRCSACGHTDEKTRQAAWQRGKSPQQPRSERSFFGG